jgi:hypothetical protein
MALYFFHLEDHVLSVDQHGTELPDDEAARDQATTMVGAILREEPRKFWDTGLWRLLVTDADRKVLFRLEFRGISSGDTGPTAF